MRPIIAIGLLAVIAFSCRKGPVFPVNEDALVRILADVHIAEAAVQNLSGAYKDSILRVYHQQVYRIHNIPEENFRQAVEMLSHEPEHMEKVYKKVEKRIQELQDKTKVEDGDDQS